MTGSPAAAMAPGEACWARLHRQDTAASKCRRGETLQRRAIRALTQARKADPGPAVVVRSEPKPPMEPDREEGVAPRYLQLYEAGVAKQRQRRASAAKCDDTPEEVADNSISVPEQTDDPGSGAAGALQWPGPRVCVAAPRAPAPAYFYPQLSRSASAGLARAEPARVGPTRRQSADDTEDLRAASWWLDSNASGPLRLHYSSVNRPRFDRLPRDLDPVPPPSSAPVQEQPDSVSVHRPGRHVSFAPDVVDPPKPRNCVLR
eukprot:EG_transcript_20611